MYRIKTQKEFVFILAPHPVNPVNPVRIPNSLLDILRIDWVVGESSHWNEENHAKSHNSE